MRYETNDGSQFEASDAYQVIAYLRTQIWNPRNSFEEFAESVAKRVKIQTGKDIPSWPPEDLVAGLLELGLLKIINE